MTKASFHPFGYQFRDSALLTMALTHPRANNIKIARKATEDYQRLEFLGDRVVGLSVAGLLYRQFPLEPEGSLAKRHAHLVSRPVLANLAVVQGLADHIIVAAAEREALAAQPSVLANVFEAVMGAVFLDAGWDVADSLVANLMRPLLAEQPHAPQDAKSALQEWAQARGLPPPVYLERGRDGPDHQPVFTVEVRLENGAVERAAAGTKRQAEQAAAKALLARMETAQ
jgi:ribonuclease-3